MYCKFQKFFSISRTIFFSQKLRTISETKYQFLKFIYFLFQVCQQGECKDSICVKFGLVSCFLTSDTVSNKRQLCELACQNPGKNNTCMSTAELAKSGRLNISNEGLSLRPGSPCDNFQGKIIHQDQHNETEIVLNSNFMIPDFPHIIKIRLAPLKFFLLRPDFAKSLPCWLSQLLRQPTGQRFCKVRTQQKKI